MTTYAQSPQKQSKADAAIIAQLTAKENQNWDAIRTGQWMSVEDMYADDAISIGYAPDLSVSRRTKQEMFGKAKLGQADFVLSDMKAVVTNQDTVILSFKVHGTDKTPPGPGFVIFASSVWVKRDGKWKTVFYQASLTK